MIPIVLFAGIVAGFTKVRWWILPISAVVWTIILAVQTRPAWGYLLGGFGIAAANAAVGVAFSRMLVHLTRLVRRSVAPTRE